MSKQGQTLQNDKNNGAVALQFEEIAMYHKTNPLMKIAEKHGLAFEDVHEVTNGDHYVAYESTRRFRIKDVMIVLYRMVSGNYEVVDYQVA